MGSVLEGTFLDNHPQAQRAEEVSRGRGEDRALRTVLVPLPFSSLPPLRSKGAQALLPSALEEESKGSGSEFLRIQLAEPNTIRARRVNL